jgi:hypothetical protein
MRKKPIELQGVAVNARAEITVLSSAQIGVGERLEAARAIEAGTTS